MTTVQESKLNMYLTLRNFINTNEGITKDLPGFSADFSVLLNTISQIQSVGEMQKTDKTGLTIKKNKLRKSLVSIAADYSRKIRAFARFTNNITLLNEARFSSWKLKRMKDVELKDYATIIFDKADPLIGSMAEYGITAEKQKVFLEIITAYNTTLSMPRTAIVEKSKATKKLAELFDLASETIKNMDYAVGIIQITRSDFFNGYKASRRRIAASTRPLALKAIAKDVLTEKHVRGALFTFLLNEGKNNSGSGNGQITKKTADKGGFNIRNMPSGTYKVQISKPGYKEKEIIISIATGERNDIVVKMERE